MLAPKEIARRIDDVRGRIDSAIRRSGREAGSVRLLLASKSQPPEAISAAHEAGARDFGENYVQEAAVKQESLRALSDLRWHLIGHLQTNKAKLAAANFVLIHSLDSIRLAEALARSAAGSRVAVLIEVNLAMETTKSGIPSTEVERVIDGARDKVDICGLMTIPPPSEDTRAARRYFAELRKLRERLAASTGLALSELSMGMTDDFEIAIDEGATIVRVGRAVFGERAR
jgi:PLP dependent protein